MLAGVEELTLPLEPPDRKHTYYLYTVLVKKEWAGEKRDKLIELMAAKYNIECIVANAPCYQTRKVLRQHTKGQRLPRSSQLGKRLLCVPIHPAMSDEDNTYIAAALTEAVAEIKKS